MRKRRKRRGLNKQLHSTHTYRAFSNDFHQYRIENELHTWLDIVSPEHMNNRDIFKLNYFVLNNIDVNIFSGLNDLSLERVYLPEIIETKFKEATIKDFLVEKYSDCDLTFNGKKSEDWLIDKAIKFLRIDCLDRALLLKDIRKEYVNYTYYLNKA